MYGTTVQYTVRQYDEQLDESLYTTAQLTALDDVNHRSVSHRTYSGIAHLGRFLNPNQWPVTDDRRHAKQGRVISTRAWTPTHRDHILRLRSAQRSHNARSCQVGIYTAVVKQRSSYPRHPAEITYPNPIIQRKRTVTMSATDSIPSIIKETRTSASGNPPEAVEPRQVTTTDDMHPDPSKSIKLPPNRQALLDDVIALYSCEPTIERVCRYAPNCVSTYGK